MQYSFFPEDDFDLEVQELIFTALDQASSGSNEAGFWLATQLNKLEICGDHAIEAMHTYWEASQDIQTAGNNQPYEWKEALSSFYLAFEFDPQPFHG